MALCAELALEASTHHSEDSLRGDNSQTALLEQCFAFFNHYGT